MINFPCGRNRTDFLLSKATQFSAILLELMVQFLMIGEINLLGLMGANEAEQSIAESFVEYMTDIRQACKSSLYRFGSFNITQRYSFHCKQIAQQGRIQEEHCGSGSSKTFSPI